jgi:hypothetical protein
MDAEAIKQCLETSGLRCTPQRYAVMAFLMEHKRHPTAAEIFEGVNRLDPRSSRATTYNNLTCQSLPRAPSASGLFVNANSFSAGCVQSALRGELPEVRSWPHFVN